MLEEGVRHLELLRMILAALRSTGFPIPRAVAARASSPRKFSEEAQAVRTTFPKGRVGRIECDGSYPSSGDSAHTSCPLRRGPGFRTRAPRVGA